MTTELFQEGDESGNLKLMQYRIIEAEKRDASIQESLTLILGTLNDLKADLIKGEARMGTHSVNIRALKDESDTLRRENKHALEEFRKEIKLDLHEIAEEVAAKGNLGTMWTAVAGAITGVPAAVYAIYVISTSSKP